MTRHPFGTSLAALRNPTPSNLPTIARGRRPTRTLQAARAATIHAMTATGADHQTIARHLGLATSTIRRYLRETL